MGKYEEYCQKAKQYLQENAELRAVLGAEEHVALRLSPLGAGEHNCNFLLEVGSPGRAYVLRVNVASQPFHASQVAYEFAALRALEPSGRTPRVLYVDDSPAAPGEGVLVEAFCAGSELSFDNLQPGDLQATAQLMADVHAVPVSDACPLHRPHDALRELYDECMQRFKLYRASAFEDARITRWVRRLTEATERALEVPRCQDDCAHIVNTEPLPSHFLLTRDASLGSFIDWERPVVGEVAQDLAYFTAPTTTFWDSEHLFSADEAASFVDEYWRAVDGRFSRGSFDARFQAYRMIAALRAVAWCCKALVQRQRGVHMTAKAAEKLPIYLSDDFLELISRECFGL